MKVTGILVAIAALTCYVNAYVIERFSMPMTTVLEIEPCGCPIIDCGCTAFDGYGSSCGYPVLDIPLINYETSICQRPFSTILDMGVAYPFAGPDYIIRDYDIAYPRSVSECGCGCGCGLTVTDLATLPPLPPVLGCPKYLRQITIPPPFL